MKNDYSMFRFYKGEQENPFDKDKQNEAFMFWGYESMFEERFNKGDFSLDPWAPANAADIQEWKTVLANNPVDKDDLFQLWMFNLLLVHLPGKHQSAVDKFLRLYMDTKL